MKVVKEGHGAIQDPRRMSAVQLARLGVEVLNRYDLALRCVTCGETWSPQIDRSGHLVPGYWHCPNKCNV